MYDRRVARHGLSSGVRHASWALAVTVVVWATNQAAADSGDGLVRGSEMRIAGPRNFSTSTGATRTVRYELESTTEIVEDGGTTPISNTGCTWISFRERVVRSAGDREFEVEVEVVDGSDESCEEGKRFTLTAPVPAAPATKPSMRPPRLGPIDLARALHASLGTPTGGFAFATRDLPWKGTVAAVRVNGMDYASYNVREARQEKSATPYISWTADGGETKQDLFVEHSWDATMRVRARDRRLACAASLERSRETAGGKDLIRTRVRESIAVDYDDGQPSRCDSPPDSAGPSRPSILTRVPELEALAKKAAGGGLGCGHGTFTVMTSRGPVRLHTGLDPIHVFGKSIAAADLVALLEARVASNRSGSSGPMSGSVGRLAGLAVSLLGHSKEPETVTLSAALLADPDDHIRRAAAIALYDLGDARPRLRPQIRAIRFPPEVVQSAGSVGKSVPDWLAH